MTPEAALAMVDARLLGPQSIPVRIRTRIAITDTEMAELYAAIDYLIAHYRHRDTVPKTLAAAFVDIYNSFAPAFEQDAEQARRLEDMAIALQDKAYQLFGA